jgi:DNA modification methylase
MTKYTPDPQNARLHPERNKALIRQSLEEVGAGRSILVGGDDTIIAGNGVYEQAQALGLTVREVIAAPDELIAVKRPDLTGEAATRAAIFDNATGETSSWDVEALRQLQVAMPALLAGLDEVQAEFDAAMAAMLPEPGQGGDEFDTTPDEGATRAQLGDLWIIGGVHRLIVGDCTDPATVARLMQGEEAEIILSDPPYCSGGFQEAGRNQGSTTATRGATIARDNLTTDGLEALIEKAVRAVPSVGCCYLFSDWRQFSTIRRAVEPLGYQYRAMLVWDKETPGMGGPWRHQFELIYFGSRRKEPPTGKSGDVLRSARSGNEHHTTEKPVGLLVTILDNTEGDLVVDPFLGSGTTLIAAHRTGRRCYGCEIEPRYADVILRRAEAEGLTVERA